MTVAAVYWLSAVMAPWFLATGAHSAFVPRSGGVILGISNCRQEAKRQHVITPPESGCAFYT